MKIVKFLGGIGNQMFQYAFVLALIKSRHKVKIDILEYEFYNTHNGYELESIFNIELPTITPKEKKLYEPKRQRVGYRFLRIILNTNHAYLVENPEFTFSEKLLSSKKTQYLNGYWQHHKYVDFVEDKLRASLIFPNFDDIKNIELEEEIRNTPNTVSVHIRRGDYIQHPTLGGICTKHYFEKAIDYINKKIANPKFIFFSNDIQWCKENFSLENAIYVDWNIGKHSYRDMQLMSLCAHNIIANSSFSWWGAWLNTNPSKIVIAPKTWINLVDTDQKALILDEYIQL